MEEVLRKQSLTKEGKAMNNLVIMKNHQAVTTSLQVAKTFGKDHRHVLEAIDELKQGVAEKSADLFYDDFYIHPQNKQTYRQVIMNRDGFTLLAIGFTGTKALKFKLQYIQAFNQMEEQINNKLPETPEERLLLTMDVTNRTVKRVDRLEEDFDSLKNDQPLAPGEYNYISRQVSTAVGRYIRAHHLVLNHGQRSKLFKDINRGLNEVTGIKTRTQLWKKDFEIADNYIADWQPSTATLTVIKQMSGEAAGQTELVEE